MHWGLGRDIHSQAFTLQPPCGQGIPVLTVGCCIFKVAVLNKLRIQSAVGSIADILKEDAHQVGRDVLLVSPVYRQLRIYRRAVFSEMTPRSDIVLHLLTPIGFAQSLLLLQRLYIYIRYAQRLLTVCLALTDDTLEVCLTGNEVIVLRFPQYEVC